MGPPFETASHGTIVYIPVHAHVMIAIILRRIFLALSYLP